MTILVISRDFTTVNITREIDLAIYVASPGKTELLDFAS
jgi:hypothetical protein